MVVHLIKFRNFNVVNQIKYKFYTDKYFFQNLLVMQQD